MGSTGDVTEVARLRMLTVLYDANCRACVRATAWLSRQSVYVQLRFVPAGSSWARRLYPELDAAQTMRDITVVGDNGAVYRGSNAWVICLWALREHRPLAYRLSTPSMAPRARRFIAWFSEHRSWLGSVA